MKVKRLLSAFVAVAIMLTTIVTLGTVSFAADTEETVIPKITIEIVPAEEGDTTWGEGQYAYNLIAKISNYGTLNCVGNRSYEGRRLDMWQLDIHFDEGVCVQTGDPSWDVIESDITMANTIGILKENNVWSLLLTTDKATAWPLAGKSETIVTDELMLIKVPFVTSTDYFTVGFEGDINIADYNTQGVRVEGGVEVYSTYANGALAMDLTDSITIGEAPAVVTPVEAMETFESLDDTVKAIYTEENGYKISTSYTTDEAGVQTHTYGAVRFDTSVTNPACIGKAESTENNFVALDKGDEAYQGIQGDSGFEDATITANANNYDGKNWNNSTAIQYHSNIDGDATLKIHGDVQQGIGSKYGAYTKMLTNGTAEYGFSFKVDIWRELDEATMEKNKANIAGGFGEVVDSTLWGRKTNNYEETNKLVRARLDKTYGYALYNETTEQWVTILPYDADNEDKSWHDVKYVVNLDNKTYTAYLDGVEKVTLPISNADAITGADGIDFNTMNNFYNGSLVATSTYYIDDVYAYENPVNVTFVDKAGNVIKVVKAHKGETVALPEIAGVTLTTTTDLTNITADTTIVCDMAAKAVVYTENFEGATIGADGSIVSVSEKPFTSITTNTTTEGYLTIADGKLVIDRAKGNYQTGFNFPAASTGTVKVSYKMQINQYGKDDTSTLNFRNVGGLTNGAYNKHAVKMSTVGYTNSKYEGSNYINAIVVYDGGTMVKLADTNNTSKTFNIEYYADLDEQCYTYVIDGVVYGPYSFYESMDEVGAVYFQGNRSGWDGKITIDDITVETKAVADTVELIGDGGAVVGYVAKASGSDKVVPVAPEVKGKKFMGWYAEDMATPVTFATYTGTKAYAKYADIVVKADFENATIDYTNARITGTGFDIALGTGANIPDSAGVSIADAAGPDGSKALYVDFDTDKKGELRYYFPETAKGIVKVSYDFKITQWGKKDSSGRDMSFGSIVSTNGTTNSMVAHIGEMGYGTYNGANATKNWIYTYDTTLNDDSKLVSLGSASNWNHIEYYVNLDKKNYSITYKDQNFGPYPLTADVESVNALFFAGNRSGWDGRYYIDNIVVDTEYSDPIVTFLNADGTKIADVTTVGGAVTVPSYTVPAGKVFVGWTDGTNMIEEFVGIKEDMTVTMVVENAVKTADFDNAAINYETGKITGTDFDIALGNGTNLPDETIIKIEEGAGKDGGAALFVDFDTEKKGNVVYSFTEVKTGKLKVSYDFKITQFGKRDSSPKDMSFGSLISGDAAAYTPAFLINESGYARYASTDSWKYINQLYTYDTTRADANEVMLGGANGWTNMTYYVDLDAKTYTIEYADAVYGPFPFTGEVESVNAILFKDNRNSWDGKYYLDNIVVDTAFAGEIPEATVFYTVTFMNGEEELAKVKVEAGEEAIYTGTTPTKAEDDNYTYTFLGWVDINGEKVDLVPTADMTVYAKFEAIAKDPVVNPGVSIIWGDINGDGTVDSTDGTFIINSTIGSGKTNENNDYEIGKPFAYDSTGKELIWGDVNGDGTVDSTDGTFIINSTIGSGKTNENNDYEIGETYIIK